MIFFVSRKLGNLFSIHVFYLAPTSVKNYTFLFYAKVFWPRTEAFLTFSRCQNQNDLSTFLVVKK